MKNIKKIIAMLLAMLIIMSAGVFTSSAARNVPAFELRLVSENGKDAVFELWLVNGAFMTFDLTLTHSSAITAFKSIYTTDNFDSYIRELKSNGGSFAESAYAATGKISIASTLPISKPTSIYKISVTKKTTDTLTATDITPFFSECMAEDETTVRNEVKISVTLGTISIDENVEMKYKSSTKIGIETSYKDTKSIKWSSSDTKVATVDENGNVYAAGKGTAVITAASVDGTVKDTCNVTVNYSFGQWLIIIILFGWIWY